MINDVDRNSRTLIVCFVVAVMVLIPLRFIELGQEREIMNSQVLGESVEYEMIEEEETVDSLSTAKLEAPYDSIDIIR